MSECKHKNLQDPQFHIKYSMDLQKCEDCKAFIVVVGSEKHIVQKSNGRANL